MEAVPGKNSDDIPATNEEEDISSKVEECEVKSSFETSEKIIKTEVFKKPQFIIGPRRGKAVGKIRNLTNESSEESSDSENKGNTSDISTCSSELESDSSSTITSSEVKPVSTVSPAQKIKENSIPLPYKEPKWGGIPKFEYGFEILKNGKILEKCTLDEKSFYVFGRLSNCDFHMQHPTISRYHAVLQYRSQESEDNPKGFYIYDLSSTHGTFLNKNRIKPNIYVRIQVGHMLKLGCSTRLFVLWGPEEDMEEESELTVTQLKEKRQLELAAKELEELEKKHLQEEKTKQEEEQGIDWGMGEDAEEETDLAENPFAATQNEELYIDDPKKTLRGWFEREGYELEYDVEEKGYGQFLCRVELPIENARGGSMMAEALVKGKKKESVVQCALEACRILDRYGLLRQATHESKKRKAKDWEADDFYDSDEDTFLDRTGTVEIKRQQRMRAAGKKDPEEVVETYDSLMKKHSEVLSQLQELELEHQRVSMDINRATMKQDDSEEEEDALDAFMMNLSKPSSDKTLLNKIKSQLATLKQEETRLRKLVNIAKPANLPELKPPDKTILPSTATNIVKKALPIVGTRRKPNSKTEQASTSETISAPKEDTMEVEEIEEEEEEEDEEEDNENSSQKNKTINVDEKTDSSMKDKEEIIKKGTEDSSVKSKKHSEITNVIGPVLPPPETNTEVEEPENNMSKKDEKRRNRNRNRKQHKNEKINEKKSDYDPHDPDYSTWVPPEGQTGDGKTKLNEKYGY